MKLIQRYPLASFFIIAYAITWSLQLTGIFLAAPLGMTLSNETNFLYFMELLRMQLPPQQAMTLGIFGLGAGPLLSAMLVTWIVDGRDGLADLWQRSIKWKLGPRWYFIVLGLPVGLSLVSLALGALAAGGQLAYNLKLPIELFFPFFIYMLVFTGIAEEPGWRGFALPRLLKRYPAEKASWILGILWGVWHFPFIIYYNAALGLVPLLFSLLGLTLGIVGWTIVNTWVYVNTQSVWMIILLHGWGNAVQSYLVLSSGNYPAQTLYGILPWVLALFLLKKYGKDNLVQS
jgi:membrane protease YdiL (CAAX protease family)